MIDHVVIDVEIQKAIEETPGGWDATDQLGVAVACLWEHRTGRMRIYGPADIEALRERLLKTDRITGYNILAGSRPRSKPLRQADPRRLGPRRSSRRYPRNRQDRSWSRGTEVVPGRRMGTGRQLLRRRCGSGA